MIVKNNKYQKEWHNAAKPLTISLRRVYIRVYNFCRQMSLHTMKKIRWDNGWRGHSHDRLFQNLYCRWVTWRCGHDQSTPEHSVWDFLSHGFFVPRTPASLNNVSRPWEGITQARKSCFCDYLSPSYGPGYKGNIGQECFVKWSQNPGERWSKYECLGIPRSGREQFITG